jgi:hypothetical protein
MMLGALARCHIGLANNCAELIGLCSAWLSSRLTTCRRTCSTAQNPVVGGLSRPFNYLREGTVEDWQGIHSSLIDSVQNGGIGIASDTVRQFECRFVHIIFYPPIPVNVMITYSRYGRMNLTVTPMTSGRAADDKCK